VNGAIAGGAPPRYESLDAWRGVAALSVVFFHCSNIAVTGDTLIGQALLAGWAGVFLFFPISGYCILAALHSRENSTLPAFLARRWRRIVVPYWASIAVAVGLALLALPFNGGSLADVTLTPAAWASILTLTQVFTEHSGRINPVYWSLGYEEQFYLVMGLVLLTASRYRVGVLVAMTGAAWVYTTGAWPWHVRGLFLEYWMCFAAGCAAYIWLHAPAERWSAVLIVAPAAVMAVASRNTALAISVATAVALVLAAPHDARLAGSRVGIALGWVGTFSYSLYLVHVPVGGRLGNLLDRMSWPAWLIVPAAVAASIAAAWIFHRLVEAPTMRSRPAATVQSGREDLSGQIAATPAVQAARLTM
jgi:peptidoglycan/LPS O-acetylase OafA/YrhL